MPRKEFEAFTRLDASDVNDFLMDQTIMVFGGTAARGSAIATPTDGMYSHLTDTDSLQYYNGTAWVAAGGGGAILQAVSTIKTDTFTSTSSTYTALTGLSVEITPSSTSSKVLAIVSVEGASTDATAQSLGMFRLMRDSTAIGVGDTAGNRTPATGSFSTRLTGSTFITAAITKSILDTPATTSSITYSVQVRTQAGTLFINRTQGDDDASQIPRVVSTLTLMEVAG